ncbi:MAG: hypothetical protein RL186_1543 [Pseudomonadota bacterium]
MGKSTTLKMFEELGVPVWNADDAVHRLYAVGGLGVRPVATAFPAALGSDGAIDREALAGAVLGQPEALKRLEQIIHPLVGADRAAFLADAAGKNTPLVVVDVPLLFETGAEGSVDAVIVVTCDAERQRARVMARPQMTDAKFAAILARQTPDAIKRQRADHIITTDVSPQDTRAQVQSLYARLVNEAT